MRLIPLLSLLVLVGCIGKEPPKFPHKAGEVDSGGFSWRYAALHNDDGEVIYAIIADHDIELTISHDEIEPEMGDKIPKGIYFNTRDRNGLWINGKRTLIPTGKFFAIRANGGTTELMLTKEEIAKLTSDGPAGITPELWKKKVKPALDQGR